MSQANPIGLPSRSVYLDMKKIISRTSAIALLVSVAGAGFAQQTFSFAGPIDSIPVTGTPVQFLAQNPVTTPYLVGANVNLISGDLTAVNPETWASEARIQLTNSAFPTLGLIVQPFTSNEITGTISITPGSSPATGGLAGTGTLVPAASTWTALFFDAFDDGTDTLVDSQWTGTVSFSTTVGTVPTFIYSSTTQTSTRVNANNPGFLSAADLGSQTRINFDDVNVSTATMAGSSSLKLNAVTVGIRRGQGALENNIRVFAAALNADGTVAGAPVLLGNQVLPPRTAAGFATELVTISGLTQTIAAQPGFISGGGFSTIYIGVQMSEDTTPGSSGWRLTTGPSPNAGGFANLFETAPATNNTYSFGPPPAVQATYYIVLEATPLTSAKISGAIDLLSTTGSGGTEDITWTLDNGTESYTGTVTVADASSSNYEITIPEAATNGNYTLKFKGGTFLAKTLNVVLTGSSLTGQNAALNNGDIDQDGEVGPGDFEAVVALFGGPGDADCDNDGEVGPGDFEIIVANFGLGDE
jgi:hypothetical protein